MVRPRRFVETPTHRYRYLRSAYKGKHLATSPHLRWILLALILGLYAINFLGGDHGVFRRLQFKRNLDKVLAANSRLRLQKERLIQEVQLEENDPMSLERLAREKYWMIGPGELIYRFNDDEVVPELPGFEGDDGVTDEGDEDKGGGKGGE